MRSRVSARTWSGMVKARETVDVETPTALATSLIVTGMTAPRAGTDLGQRA